MDRGDIYYVELHPLQGWEYAGSSHVLVVSPRAFNARGTQLVCPITSAGSLVRDQEFAVSLWGTYTQGVVLCHRPRALDLLALEAGYAGNVPREIVEDVLGRLLRLLA
ncbi:type II toxin-antitoxin system PemK/MazF family toxin [Singulisphaera rosea]